VACQFGSSNHRGHGGLFGRGRTRSSSVRPTVVAGFSRKRAKELYGRYDRGAGIALVLGAMAGLCIHARYLWHEPIDDAGISVAYALSALKGQGLRVTAASQAVEGISNPAWTLLLALTRPILSANVLATSRWLGLALAVASLPLFAAWRSRAVKDRFVMTDAIGPVLTAANPSFVHWTIGGLETGLHVFGLALAGWLLFGKRARGRRIGLGLCVAMVALTRPESMLHVVVLGVVWMLLFVAARRKPCRDDGYAILSFAIPVLAYFAFRFWYFSQWLPNTYYAKHSFDFHGLNYASGFWTVYRLPCAFAAVGLLLAPFGGRRTWLPTVACAGLLLTHAVFAIWIARGDWMREWRFLVPAVPLVGLAASLGGWTVVRFASRALRRIHHRMALPGRGLATALLLLAAWFGGSSQLARAAEVRAQGIDVPLGTTPVDSRPKEIRDLSMVHPLIAVTDLGWAGLNLRSGELIDLAGLADVSVARNYQRAKLIEDYLENEGLPAVAMAWGPGLYFWHLRVSEKYDRTTGSPYISALKGLTPSDDPRCPDGKATSLQWSPHEIAEVVTATMRAGDAKRALAQWRCAFTYHTEQELPRCAVRLTIADDAERRGAQARALGRIEASLRSYSLAAIISQCNAHRSSRARMEAERLREELFP
jgi:hypothetical protein